MSRVESPLTKLLGYQMRVVYENDIANNTYTAGKTDNITDTVSYTDIYRIAKEILEGPSQNLLESVAHLIASTTLTKFPQIQSIRVKVGKPHVAVQGSIDYLGVEIIRGRKHA
ncbi:hypothetical protein HPP92_016697 [Vanilla planifolia]|uniref:dihydroneopterin aldolase n=1 Tax=Vanilla planifolia TaxID=51239 RepID=A0A835QJC7_VANPL|nr:hypothetical protein HPP92_016697 [Vanilla planifolia]